MMTLTEKGKRIGITFESLTWFLVFTALGTVIGMIAWDYVQPWLPAWVPGANAATGGNAAIPTAPPTGASSVTPSSTAQPMGRVMPNRALPRYR